MLLDTHPVTWRQLQGWTTTLPLGVDSIRMRRVFDTDSLAATFPLASADLPAPLPGDGMPTGGVLYGVNTDSRRDRLVGPVGPAQPQLRRPGPLRCRASPTS